MKSKQQQVPVTALTATAPRAVADDVLSSLGIRDTAREFALSFFRSNLTLRVLPKPSGRIAETGEPAGLAALADFVCAPERENSCGIVYCLSRDEAEETARFLREEAGVAAAPYHAGMPAKQREAVQLAWRRHEEEEGNGGGDQNRSQQSPKKETTDSIRVVVATIAFGMGIDKAAVRFVVHATLAKCLAGYFQEAGRAGVRVSSSSFFVLLQREKKRGQNSLFFLLGFLSSSKILLSKPKQRDGKPAECVVFFSNRDVSRIRSLLRMSGGGGGGGPSSYASKRARYERGCAALERMRDWCLDSDSCRHAGLLRHFGESMNTGERGGRCGSSCDVCRGEVVKEAPPPDDGEGGTGGGSGGAKRGRRKKARASGEGAAATANAAANAGPASFTSAASLLAAGGGGGGSGGSGAGGGGARTTTAGRGRGRGRTLGGGNPGAPQPPPSLRAAAAAHLRAGNRHAEAATFVSASVWRG